ncbi:uncharacterized protein LOC141674004 [Apium graveolens]|uniref:uncharacterized protein LOC141674004 n=1 Tax=Apium graveolens TaxID=4045 RepID=UPI003D799701
MKESETVSEFFSKVSTITNQIISYGDTLKDKNIVIKVLRSLPAKFGHVVAAIEVSKDLITLTLDELMGALEAYQEQIQRFAKQSIDQAFQAKLNIYDKKEVSHQKDYWFKNRNQANFSEQDGDVQVIFSCMNAQLQQYNCWYIDSACSNHMSGIRDLFAELDESQKSEVKIGEGKTLKIEGK